MLSAEDKQVLLSLARRSIEDCLGKSGKPCGEVASGESLCMLCGVFVSVYIKGELRGCIGTFSETEPLYRNVVEMAAGAATGDSRFKPLREDEIGEMDIEISVLSPRRRITGVNEIVPGKHGVYIQKGSCRGTLLPQVAISQGWTTEEFLGNCSKYKAGIGWEGWRTAELFVYEAIVFGTREVPGEHQEKESAIM